MPLLLAGLLAVAGSTHFLRPELYDAIVPHVLPAPRFWTYASGVVELALAGGVAHPRTRRRAAWGTAALFVAVFPANLQHAVDQPGPLTIGRLPLQVPLVLWAVRVARRAPRDR